MASSIFFVIPGFVLWIYFILVYQVFTFEPELSIPECFKRSFILVRGNWLRTFLLLAILSFFSIYIITEGITVVFDFLNLTDKICPIFNFISNMVPLDLTNRILVHFKMEIITNEMISKAIFTSILSFIVTGLTLPMRSICWTLWYTNLAEISQHRPSSSIQKRVRKVKKDTNNEDY